MYRLLYYKLKHSLFSVKLLSIIIMLSITASLFCINVMFSYAEDLYLSSYDASWYSTICISNIDYDKYAEISEYIEKNQNYSIGSSLLFSKTNNAIVIGWDGSDPPGRWFPEMGGRFFNETELSQSQNIAYISRKLYESNSQKPYITIDDVEYEIIGYGWILGRNFEQGIGAKSSQTIINASETSQSYIIIPHLTYKTHEYRTDMILVHINEITYSQLSVLVKNLQNEFVGIEFVQSDNNSNAMRTIEKLKYVPCGIVLAIMICISLIQMFDIWFEETKNIVYSYIVCGVSRKKMLVIMLLEILFFTSIGMGFALILQRLLLPFLTYLGVSCMPNFTDIIATLIAAFLLLTLLLYKRMLKNISVDRSAK